MTRLDTCAHTVVLSLAVQHVTFDMFHCVGGFYRCTIYVHTVTITARARRGDTSTAVPCYGSGEVANEGLRHKDNRSAFPLGTRIHFFLICETAALSYVCW
jgi:hypothetical protein